ncbi:tetratricopeptide repeat-containing sensor histidine kinase [Bacteroides salyersiae]|uniref:tetratricopeptide repeat-containing sensor histidine kinase n=1 Tax=Bacteroides salyersiae TaxID=291644 RepID=UPI001C8C5C40|nr:HAMP domain-containing sensor histidine kinase [Bacteroides salyersiae]
MRTITPRRILFVISLILCCTVCAQEEKEFNVDSALYSYFQRCQENVGDSKVLHMADTLYWMSEKKGDQRMQAVALTLKLDHYYFKGDKEDSIIHYTKVVKEFAEKTNQPKYYYFVWNNRLILYYLKTGKSNIALYEAQEMLKDAQKRDSKIGLLYCYNSLYQIYEIKDLKSLAIEYCLKGIELTETYHVDNYNISTSYTEVAKYYINQGDVSKALEMLKKAESTANASTHVFSVKLGYVHYYLAINNPGEAWNRLQEAKVLVEEDKKLDIYKKLYYENEFFYYKQTRQYQKALVAADKQIEEELRLNEHALQSSHYRMKGEIYRAMGRKDLATDFLAKYILLEDSIRQSNEEQSISGFATLVNMERLNAEKKELVLQAQKKELHNKQLLIISLVTLLVFVFIFLYRENRLNKRLLHSEEELRKAKNAAETASQMKTLFIQSMSHEIRTPLNSIVGFSQILGDRYQDDPDTKVYASIIEENSNNLLRLITDVLELSDLDKTGKMPADIMTNINDCCKLSVDNIRKDVQEGVELHFQPAREEFIVKSNPERIMQVLVNLLHNAAKFTPSGDITLAYSIMKEGQQICFTITDTGPGIPLEKQEAVFSRFAKLDSYSQGTGLGLSICRGIADKLGGSLTLDSKYTKGCRFVFIIPYS